MQEHLAIDQHRAAAGEEQLVRADRERADRQLVEELVAHAIEVDAAADKIDLAAVPVEHLRRGADHTALPVRLHCGDQRLQKARVGIGIVVDQRQVAPGGRGGAAVHGRRKADIAAVREHTHGREALRHQFERSIL